MKNALKFSKRKAIAIKVCFDYEKQLLLVHVIDKGMGIRPEDMQKLFSLFGKLDHQSQDQVHNIV